MATSVQCFTEAASETYSAGALFHIGATGWSSAILAFPQKVGACGDFLRLHWFDISAALVPENVLGSCLTKDQASRVSPGRPDSGSSHS
jgi:hypothetical protein